MSWVLIANPEAGGGRGRRLAERAARSLEESGRPLELHFTRERGHGTELARRAVEQGAERIVVCGGDGTIGEMLPALAGTRVELGLLPFGTANDLARALRVPRRLRGALHTLRCGRARPMDLGRAAGGFFATVAAFGFDAEVSHAVRRGRAPLSGTLGYAGAALALLRSYRPVHARLEGEFGTVEGKVFLVASGNTSCYGGGLRIAPDADPRDGKFDVCIVGALSTRGVLGLMPRLFLGTHIRHPAVRLERTAWLKIHTDEPHLLHADGEYLGATPLALEVRPAALRIVVPAGRSL